MTHGRRSTGFDEIRRAWIAAHHGASTIQRRRRRDPRTQEQGTSPCPLPTAVPDPHDNTVIPPLWLRTAKSPASQIELLAVTVVALVITVRVGPAGAFLKRVVTQLISRILYEHSPSLVVVVGCHTGTADLCSSTIPTPTNISARVVLSPMSAADPTGSRGPSLSGYRPICASPRRWAIDDLRGVSGR